MQYSYKLWVLRSGLDLQLFGLNEKAETVLQIDAVINSKGFEIKKPQGEEEFTLCGFGSFLYPDRVEEEEIDLLAMMHGSILPIDRHVINLCSMLCAQWAAGHSEEALYDTMRSTLAYWSKC